MMEDEDVRQRMNKGTYIDNLVLNTYRRSVSGREGCVQHHLELN